MERLRHVAGVDGYQLYEETQRRPTHTVKVLLLEQVRPGAALTIEALRRHLRERLPSLPILRQVVVPVPGHFYHPVWVDAGMPDLERHVQLLPAADAGTSLEAAAGRLAGTFLPRDAPLWRLWLAPQTGERPAAVFLQLHHALADGHASARLLEAMFGDEPGTEPRESRRAPAPARRVLLRSGGAELARLLTRLPSQTSLSIRAACRRRLERSDSETTARAFEGPRVPWGGSISAGRSAAWTALTLDDVHRVRAGLGATVGELVLAVTGEAVNAYLESTNSATAESLTAVVPVGSSDWSDATSGNRNTHTFTSLHTDVGDPVERIRRISMEMRANRRGVTTESLDRWAGWMDFYPLFRALYLATVIPMGRLLHKPPATMIVSTVRGPRDELAIGGCRVADLYSIGVLTEHLGLNVTVWSYADRLGFGVVCAKRFAALADAVAYRVPDAFAELAAASTPAVTTP